MKRFRIQRKETKKQKSTGRGLGKSVESRLFNDGKTVLL